MEAASENLLVIQLVPDSAIATDAHQLYCSVNSIAQ